MKEHRGISRAVRLINSILDNGLVLLLLLGLAYGCYALWDSQNLAQEATAEQYAVYKPQEDTLGFAELQALNEDVIGWITVYGTPIDYPVVQGGVLFIAVVFAFTMLLVDILYAFADPRIKSRYSSSKKKAKAA